MQIPRPRWSSSTKLAVTLLLLALGIYLLSRFREAIGPFVIALILAYVISPVVRWLEKGLRIRRVPAILIAYLATLSILAGLLLVLIPILMSQSSGLNLDLQRIIREAEFALDRRYWIAGQAFEPAALFDRAVGSIQGVLEPVFTQTIEVAIGAISSLVWLVFIVVVSFYFIKDGQAASQWFEDLAPPAYRDDFIRLRIEISLLWASFFRGQITLALVVATIITSAGTLIGLPFSLAMGLLAGLLEFLPSIGHAIWLILASILALFLGSTWLPVPNWVFMLLIVGMHLFFQQFDLNYLIPRIIGRQVHLPPLVVILGIVTGALLAGVLGIFLAAPTIASARVLGRYIYANLLDEDPFPSESSRALPPPNPRWWRKASSQTLPPTGPKRP
jgi:predicted PurR-regulated permease PerM